MNTYRQFKLSSKLQLFAEKADLSAAVKAFIVIIKADLTNSDRFRMRSKLTELGEIAVGCAAAVFRMNTDCCIKAVIFFGKFKRKPAFPDITAESDYIFAFVL